MSTGCCDELIDVGRLAVRQRRVLIWVMLINLATVASPFASAGF